LTVRNIGEVERLWCGSNWSTRTLTDSANANGATDDLWASANGGKWALADVWEFVQDDSTRTDETFHQVRVYIRHYQSGYSNDGICLEVWNGIGWTVIKTWSSTDPPPTAAGTYYYDVTSILDTWTKINAAKVRIRKFSTVAASDSITWYVDSVEIRVGFPEEAYMDQGDPDTNYGADSYMRVRSDLNANSRGIIRFDLSCLPAGANITLARLALCLVGYYPTGDRTIGAHRVDHATPNYEADWVESEVTWNNYKSATAWGTAGGNFNATATDSQVVGSTTPVWYFWDVTSDCDALAIRSWILKDATEDSVPYYHKTFEQKERATASPYPAYLEVTYTVEAVGQPTQVRTRRIPAMNYIGGL